jgi:hypothetical protein
MDRKDQRRGRRARLAMIAVLGAALSGSVAPAADAHTFFNRFALNVSGTAVAGAPGTFQVLVTNEGIGVLNTLKVQAPSGLTLTGATTSRGKVTRTGNLLALKKLVLPPGWSVTVTVTAGVRCDAAETQTWAAAKGNGLLGLPYRIDPAHSSLTTTVQGACHLTFVAQPTDTSPGQPITDAAAGPVTVGLFDGADAAIIGGDPVEVSVAIGTNPGGGMLGGDPSVATVNGVASFADLTIDAPGELYSLAASASGFAAATSGTFTVAGVVAHCEANEDCVASLESEDGATSAQINAIADPSAPILTASWTDEGLDCDGYEERSPSTLVFNVTTSREKLVTISFDTGIEDYYVNPNHYQICYESPTPFAERFHGDLVTKGVLPECALPHYESNPPPCVLDRYVYGSIVTITFQAPEGDPKGRV